MTIDTPETPPPGAEPVHPSTSPQDRAFDTSPLPLPDATADRTDQQLGAEDQSRRQRVRLYNDLLRILGSGGRLMVSAGLSALGPQQISAVRWAVARFEDFNANNDPYGEHDCAILDVGPLSILWKIDYYDLDLAGCSPDPSDPSLTIRVLTLMLAEEY